MTTRAGWCPGGRAKATGTMLVGGALLALTGCGEGGGILAGTIAASTTRHDGRPDRGRSTVGVPDFDGDPSWVQVKAARLRATPGGCEVDVTFTNVTVKTISAGFDYVILDASGQTVVSRSTAVQQVAAGQTATVSSEGTTAGPSGVPCPPGGRPRLAETSVYNL